MCPKQLASNHNQSMCYDPIVHEKVFTACYIVNTIGLCLCLFIAFVYWRNRDTPVVRSSDYKLSMMQLTLCIILFIVLPALSLPDLSRTVCTLRPCILGPLLVAIVSIVVCKAEKILIIFYTRRRLTTKDVTDIYIRQTVILVFLMVLDMIILPSTFPLPSTVEKRHFISPEKISEFSGDKYYMQYCSNDDHFDFQIVYCVGLLLLAILQGYRGRKLPRNYNEGNSIIVSAASTICACAFKIWLATSDQHKYERTSTAWLSLSASVMFIILPLYGPKMYIMLFLPHKNTKKHLMNRMLFEEEIKNRITVTVKNGTSMDVCSSSESDLSPYPSISRNQERNSHKTLLNKKDKNGNGFRDDVAKKRRSNSEHIEMSFI